MLSTACPHRPYTPEQELQLFDLARVDTYLSQWEWLRTVDKMGKISLSDRNYFLDKNLYRLRVRLKFDPPTRQFVAFHPDGHERARFTVPQVSKAYILGGSFPLSGTP